VTTATGHGGAGDVVWRTPGVVASLLAGTDGEAKARSARHRGALACPWAWPCTCWRRWVTWARPVLGVQSLSLARGVYGQPRGSEGYLQDMVGVRGEGRGDGKQSGWHEVMTWPCHGGQVRWERVHRGCSDANGGARVSGM
jgi:hypothetical protein